MSMRFGPPPAYGWLHDANGNDPLTFVRGELPEPIGLTCPTMPVYSYEQLRQHIDDALERAAKVCDADPHAMNDHAAYIRAMKSGASR